MPDHEEGPSVVGEPLETEDGDDPGDRQPG